MSDEKIETKEIMEEPRRFIYITMCGNDWKAFSKIVYAEDHVIKQHDKSGLKFTIIILEIDKRD